MIVPCNCHCDAPDGRPVSEVLILLVPSPATGKHLKILADAAQMFFDGQFRKRIDQCGDPAEIKRIFDAWPEKMVSGRIAQTPAVVACRLCGQAVESFPANRGTARRQHHERHCTFAHQREYGERRCISRSNIAEVGDQSIRASRTCLSC